MNHFDRALTKAYARRETVGSAAVLPAAQPGRSRGWVSRLRTPNDSLDPAPVDASDARDPEHAGFVPRLREPVAICETAEPPTTGRADSQPAMRQVQATRPVARLEPVDVPAAIQQHWRWPETCLRLLASPAAQGLRELANLLAGLPREGRGRLVTFSGTGRGVGRSTFLLTLARVLAGATDLRLLIVDADASHHDLARLLQVTAPPSGSIVSLIPGRLSLADLATASETRKVAADIACSPGKLLTGWRIEFDLLLIDAGPWESLTAGDLARSHVVDSVIGVRRFERPADHEASRVCREFGFRLLGVVETFAAPAECGWQGPRPGLIAG